MSEGRCLNDLKPGESARVQRLVCTGGMRRRFLDLGLTCQTLVRCVGKSPSGDPSAFLIRGAVIAIRSVDGKDVLIDFPEGGSKHETSIQP